jgi:WD40 repeat protein
MSVPPTPTPNPYVGPRAFEQGEGARFFGRDRELTKLLNLLIARRLVLLYAPSGAGKTSLIQAALVPQLQAEDFLVRRLVRVGLEVPPELAATTPNRYLLATLLSLDEELPPQERTPPEDLARMDLAIYLDRRRGDSTADEVLIFDQFEELLTTDPADRTAKEAFLGQLGAALENPRRWALFAIREDYLGSLRPLLVPLPTRLDALFRLDLLDPAQAQQAMQGPALVAGVAFSDAAAAQLADDLRRTIVQRLDGTSEAVLGQTIDPVQLQVVCYRLWERTFAAGDGQRTIEAADIDQAGDVDEALRFYYAERVAAIAEATGVRERQIRDWVERRLITEAGLRGQVLREPEITGGLSNAAIRALVDAHLVRAEERRGATWFELSHDRLIAPIHADNARWRQVNLSTIQRQAALWDEQGRPDGMLLRDDALHIAEQGALAPGADLNELERTFLAASKKLRDQLERERRANRRLQLLALIATVVSLVAVILAVIAWQSSVEATLQGRAVEAALKIAETAKSQAAAAAAAEGLARQTAEAGGRIARVNEASLLASRADSELTQSPERALLLAVEANQVGLRGGEPVAPAARQSLHRALSAIGGVGLGTTTSSPTDLAISADGRWVAVGAQDGTTWLWALAADGRAQPPRVLRGHDGAVRSVTLSPDGRTLAAGGQDAQILLWDLSAGSPSVNPIRLSGPAQPVTMLRFSPDARWLVSTGFLTETWRWDLGGGAAPAILSGHTALIRDLAISPNGRWLLTASEDGSLRRWELGAADPAAGVTVLSGHDSIVTELAITPDGGQVISGSLDGTVRSWNLAAAQPAELFSLPAGFAVERLALSADGRWLVAADSGAQTARWDLRAADIAASRTEIEGRVGKPVFSARQGDEGIVFAPGSERSLRSWQLSDTGDLAQERLLGHDSQLVDLERSADGRWLASAGLGGDIRLWDAAAFAPTIPLDLATDVAASQVVSGDGRLALAIAGTAITLHDLRTSDPRAPALALPAAGDAVTELVAGGGRWLAWHSSDGRLRLADLAAADPQGAIRELRGAGTGLADLAFSPDGRWLAGVSSERVLLWSIGGDGATEQRADLGLAGGLSLGFRPDGRALAIGTIDGRIDLIDLDGAIGQPVLQLNPTPSENFDAVERLAFSPDGQLLAGAFRQSGTASATLRVWRLAPAPDLLIEFGRESGTGIRALAFNSDGRWLAAGGSDRLIQLWDLQDAGGAPRRIALRGHEDAINDLAFSPVSKSLASAGEDGSLRLWDILDPAEQGRPLVLRRSLALVPPVALMQVAFSDDGRWLISLGANSRARLWNLHQDELLARACLASGRNLNEEEWRQFFPGQPYRSICTP